MSKSLNAEPLWTIGDLAEYLEVPVETVRRWRRTREGPPAFRCGKHLRWNRSVVDAWLAERQERREPAAGAARARPKPPRRQVG
jgi:excisionase family DNA binding protein